MVIPMTRWPSRISMPATVELSTPPDMATRMVSGISSVVRLPARSAFRRDTAKMSDAVDDGVGESVYLFHGVGCAERDADRRAGLAVAQADGAQHVRRFDRAARAGRSAGNREAAEVERDNQRLAFDEIETDVAGVGNPRTRYATLTPRFARTTRSEYCTLQAVSQRSQIGSAGGSRLLPHRGETPEHSRCRRGGRARDGRRRESGRARVPLRT